MINYESHIQGDKPVVADFFAEWCEPCKLMEPIFRKVAARVGARATILNIDIDIEPALAELYNIKAVPTVMIFHKGQVLWRKNGISSAHEILERLQLLID